MRRRYEIRATFDDADYGDLQVGTMKKYWSLTSARTAWFRSERAFALRDAKRSWHFRIFDNKTGNDITPEISPDVWALPIN